jgi:hypothetical protein
VAKSRLDKPMEWYPWNPLTWQASRRVQRMGWAERGFYRELMDECYLKGSIPASLEGLAELLDCDPEEISDLWGKVSRCFGPHPEVTHKLVSPFIESIRAEQLEVRIKQAERRKGGKGGQAEPAADGASGSPEGTDDHPESPGGTRANPGSPGRTTVRRGSPKRSSTVQDSTVQDSTFLPPPSEAEGSGSKPPRAAAAASAVPEWMLTELKVHGIVGAQARSLVGKLGETAVRAALVKVRAKKPAKNAAGLLVRKGAELAEEGSAILQTRLECALKLAPSALQDARWATLPEQLQRDPEVQAAWCTWKASEAGVKLASEEMRGEAGRDERHAAEQLLDLMQARHPDPEGLRLRMFEALPTVPSVLNPVAIRKIAFWKALEGHVPAGVHP